MSLYFVLCNNISTIKLKGRGSIENFEAFVTEINLRIPPSKSAEENNVWKLSKIKTNPLIKFYWKDEKKFNLELAVRIL